MKKLLSSLLIVLWSASCTQDQPCLENVQAKVVFSFKKINDSLQEKDTVLNYPLLSIGNNGYYGFKNNKLVTDIPSHVTIADFDFISDTSNPVPDIINIQYTPILHYISKECGFQFFYKLNDISSTNNQIKQIKIIDSNINDQVQNPHIIITL
jgi:hypothetical protein